MMDEDIEDIAGEISNFIMMCEGCAPYQKEVDKTYWLGREPMPISELLILHNVPDEQRDEVLELVQCLQCTNQPTDRHYKAAVKSPERLEFKYKIQKFHDEHRSDLREFHNHLGQWPYLGPSHDFGTRIMDAIERL